MTQRIKHIFPTKEIPHKWAHQTQESASNRQHNLFFDGATIYSYRESFPIARIYTRRDGQRCILLTTQTYSVTTAKHISAVRCAIPRSQFNGVFTVAEVIADRWSAPDNKAAQALMHSRNVKDLLKRATNQIAKAARARSSFHIENDLSEANDLVAMARDYCKFFKLRVPKLPEVPEIDYEKLAAIKQRERMMSAAKAAKQKAARAEAMARDAEQLEKWLRGEAVSFPYTHREYNNARLRVVNDVVETSQGARVPLSHARRALIFVRQVVASGVEYETNGHTFHIGDYRIDRVEADGTLHAGCHVIQYAEIERIAPQIERS